MGPRSFWIDDAALIDQKCHYSGIAILRRISDKREAASHLAIDQVALGAADGVRALPGQNMEIVAVERLRRVVLAAVSLPAAYATSGPMGLSGCPSSTFQ